MIDPELGSIVGDEIFTNFRRRLEDFVTQAINCGITITNISYDWFNEVGCYCPLGCFPGLSPAPGADQAGNVIGITGGNADLFISGFGICGGCYNSNDPYFKLGMLYRKRFCE